MEDVLNRPLKTALLLAIRNHEKGKGTITITNMRPTTTISIAKISKLCKHSQSFKFKQQSSMPKIHK